MSLKSRKKKKKTKKKGKKGELTEDGDSVFHKALNGEGVAGGVDSTTLDTRPLANCGHPANNAVQHDGALLN